MSPSRGTPRRTTSTILRSLLAALVLLEIAPGAAASLPASESQSVLDPDQLGVPARPSCLHVVSFDGGKATLAWRNADKRALGFAIERSSDGQHWILAAEVAPSATQWSLGQLETSRKWLFRIRSYGRAGMSDYSRPAAVRLQEVSTR